MGRRALLAIPALALVALVALVSLRKPVEEAPLRQPEPTARETPAVQQAPPSQPAAQPRLPPGVPEDLPARLLQLAPASQQELREKLYRITRMRVKRLDAAARMYMRWTAEGLSKQALPDMAVRSMLRQRDELLQLMARHCSPQAPVQGAPRTPVGVPEDLPDRLLQLDPASQQKLREKIYRATRLPVKGLDGAARIYLRWTAEDLRKDGISEVMVRKMLRQRDIVLQLMARHCAEQESKKR